MAVRIGFDVTAALTQGGGIGRYTRELIQSLVTEGLDYEFRLFSARPPASPPVPNSLPVGKNVIHKAAPIEERWLYRIWYRANLPLPVQLFTGRLDLFHSPDFVLPPVSGSIPTLLTVHDLSFIHYPASYPPRLVTYLNRVVPRSVDRADHILADSQSTLNDLVSLWNVPLEKMSVLYSGVNKRFSPVRDKEKLASIRHRYVLGERPIILTIGTVQPRKNYETLVRAFSRIAGRIPHNLIIAGGRGWLVDGLLAEIDRLELGDRIHLTGFVSDADLPALYSISEIFVFPSYYEGFGLPLLEAMACGTPIISSNSSSLPEVASSEYATAAILLAPTDEEGWALAMHNLATNEEKRRSLVDAGFRQVVRFGWDNAARQLLALYDRLLSSTKSSY
jgi:glycosyltransferase involved in cell wall biosynthesis